MFSGRAPQITRMVAAALLAGATVAAVATAQPAHAIPRTEQAAAWMSPSGSEAQSERSALPVRTALLDVCPVDGPATFEDSWGWARSGGRSHQGVDMIAERGTPLVAVRSGEAQFKQNQLGGRAIWITADNGDRFYYAHLSDWEGQSRYVEAGDVIGYVGSTGNAGGPHLHFETHPGGSAENPYPHTLGACVPTPEEIARASNNINSALPGRVLP